MDIDIRCELPDSIDREFLSVSDLAASASASSRIFRRKSIANLPQIKTKVLEAQCINGLVHLKLFTASNTVDEAKQWIVDFEEVSKTSYSIAHTISTQGRYNDFKQYLHCRHKTKSKYLSDSSNNTKGTRNTNCSSTLNVTLHAKKKRYRSKDTVRNELFKEMRCEIDLILTHNHNIGSADALSFRKVSSETREKLINLYCKGHSPATALQTLKMDIYKDYTNYEQILADRSHCPDYNYCYNVYIKQFKEKYGPFLLGDNPDLTTDSHNPTMETTTGFDDNNSNANDTRDKGTKEEDDAELIKNAKARAQVIIEDFSNLCAHHIENSPNNVGAALEKMWENMMKIRTVSAFTSACSSFASDYRRRNRRCTIPVQPTALSRRRTLISGQKSNVGGRPRKNTIKRKKTVHKLATVIGNKRQ